MVIQDEIRLDEVREEAKRVALHQDRTVYVVFDKKTLKFDWRIIRTGKLVHIGEYDRDGYWRKY